MSKQNTRIKKLVDSITTYISISFLGTWKTKSIAILSLLLGYYLSSNLISYLLNNNSIQRIILLLIVLVSIELIIRLRSRIIKGIKLPLYWVVIDNLRIGTTYAITLEAFKLGS